ncbi:Uma2 family endonuclease [Thermoflexus hugenholtzii]
MGTQAEEILALLQKPGVLTEGLRRKLLELLLPPMENPYVPYEEFLARADEDTLAEWVQVEIHPYSPASRSHQDIAGFLYGLLRAYVERHRLGVVLPAPFQMKLSRSGREPDLLFVAQEHLHRLHPTHLEGPADLVVEIVSPESAPRDRGEKFYEYQEAGIPEYWLIDPQSQWAEFYQRNERGRFQHAPPDPQGIYRSQVIPGFWLRVDWLWQDPLPSVDMILLEIGGEAYARRLIERIREQGWL